MRMDSLERADAEAASFGDLPMVHVWDPKRRVGDLYSRTLGLKSTAWDFEDVREAYEDSTSVRGV